MQVTKSYARGGFFGNSQDKFSDMAGAQSGINMAYANRGLLKTKGAALRREKRYLKGLERSGQLTDGTGGASAARLDYLRNVQKDRAKKAAAGIGAAALIAGTAGLATGALGAGAAGAGAAGAAGGGAAAGGAAGAAAGGAAGAGASGLAGAGATGAATWGDKLLKGLKIARAGKDLIQPTAEQEADLQQGVEEAGGGYGKYGMRILKGEGGLKVPEGADVRSLLASLDQFQEERDNDNRMIAPGRSNREILEMLLKKYEDSVPSIMGPKATDRYFNR